MSPKAPAGQFVAVPMVLTMDGWWKCCNCDNLVNPAWNLTTCPVCNHNKCYNCTTAESSSLYPKASST